MSDIEEIKIEIRSLKEANIRNEEYHREERIKEDARDLKINEMHQILTATGMLGKAFRWILGTIIATSAAMIAVKQLFHWN
jgi:hypothetical protein